MAKPDSARVESWVQERLHILKRDDTWEPDAAMAIAKIKSRASGPNRLPQIQRVTAALVAFCACLVWLPEPRALAQRCVKACEILLLKRSVVEGELSLIAEGDRRLAPDFSLPASDGRTIHLSAYRGTVVAVDFWATWCGGCKEEIPWYIEFQNRYRARGFQVIGIAMDDGGWPVVRPFLKDSNINYSVVLGTKRVARRYQVDAMPVTLLIDRSGKIAATHTGVVDRNRFEAEIKSLLASAH